MFVRGRVVTVAVFGAVAGVMSLIGAACTGESDDADVPVSFEDISAIVDDLNAYWAVADSDLGFDYEPVPRDRVGTGADGLTCDLAPIESDEVAGNAFVDAGCEEGITVAYDPAYVGTSLAAAEATMAHEWGHVVQAQAGDLDLSEDPNGLPIDAELQADCFAGAWAAERAEASIERLRNDTAQAGDPNESDIEDPHAHGTPDQRLAAFDIGLQGGPVACIDELVAVLPE